VASKKDFLRRVLVRENEKATHSRCAGDVKKLGEMKDERKMEWNDQKDIGP